ncbi:hypothetical protein [uncultured Photobacterium sp.]|uniref:hypothetical protein n=1 Tax=uncultured Photobacterium sp. TaxID=173973 RepID=UPI00260664B3|nr:hypothetical protein [uncultured Photobacterium sp.]
MAYIKHFINGKPEHKAKFEAVESSIPLDVKVFKRGDTGVAEIVSDAKGYIAKITSVGIELNGSEVEQVINGKFGLFGWLLKYPHEFILSVRTDSWIGGNTCFKKDGQVIGKITYGGGLIWAMMRWIKIRCWVYEPKYIKIDFNENLIEPHLALCLLLVESCKPFSPSS